MLSNKKRSTKELRLLLPHINLIFINGWGGIAMTREVDQL